uniref:Bab1_0 protein n=1 Tax=Fopius arisanus TaxID=64838 RepID=A0A0C9QY18_9HYME
MSELSSESLSDQDYSFKWSDYQNHLSTVVRELLEEDCMVDVTLCVAGERIHAHRIVLCACSTLFQEILSETMEDHPIIIISDISANDVRSIVEFSYHGEVRIPVENISNLLEAAQLLRINGLMEIEGLDEHEPIVSKELTEEISNLENSSDNDGREMLNAIEGDSELHEDVDLDDDNSIERKRRGKKKRDYPKKEYSEVMLETAISDLKNGKTLIEASMSNNIPRSTLYMRAKALGIQLHAARNEYPIECMKSAIETVLNGASLQHASEMYGIPKTVLWRRIQKEGYQIVRPDMRRAYASEKRVAAVKALERGENLTKVSNEFKIPKTTLFRDKVKLVDEGKLPESFWKRRKTEDEDLKKSRLEKAVAACKGGKMSQAAAATLYGIPKTTIWRKLQQKNRKNEDCSSSRVAKKQKKNDNTSEIKSEMADEDFSLCEVSSEIPITYIDEDSIPQDSVIILTTEDVDSLNLEDNRQIIVNAVSSIKHLLHPQLQSLILRSAV